MQTCIVHAIRAALRFVPYKDKKKVAADLKRIYTAVDRDHAERELERFAETWDPKYPMISASWIENWERIVPFLAFPPDVRRAVYTTDESVKGSRRISRRQPVLFPASGVGGRLCEGVARRHGGRRNPPRTGCSEGRARENMTCGRAGASSLGDVVRGRWGCQ